MAQLQMLLSAGTQVSGGYRSLPEGYILRNFQAGDDAAYIALMRGAGFSTTDWNTDNLEEVLKLAKEEGVFLVEHRASAQLVATALGWNKPSTLFPEGGELGWVGGDEAHAGKGLGGIVSAAAVQKLLNDGLKEIYLLTDDFRLPAIMIYLRIGFLPVLCEPDMKSRWQEVLKSLNLKDEDYPGVERSLPA